MGYDRADSSWMRARGRLAEWLDHEWPLPHRAISSLVVLVDVVKRSNVTKVTPKQSKASPSRPVD